MAERIKVKAAVGYELMGIGEALVDKLIEDGKLPHDFDFRALGIDREQRADVVHADVLAKLGYGEGSNDRYLTGPLPDCVSVPDIDELVELMSKLDEDYYRIADLRRVARSDGIAQIHVYNAWAGYILAFNPKLFDIAGLGELETGSRYRKDRIRHGVSGLNKIIIRDEALLELYDEKYRLLGREAIERRLLHNLLLNNHMELGVLY